LKVNGVTGAAPSNPEGLYHLFEYLPPSWRGLPHRQYAAINGESKIDRQAVGVSATTSRTASKTLPATLLPVLNHARLLGGRPPARDDDKAYSLVVLFNSLASRRHSREQLRVHTIKMKRISRHG
jgi:hypothetical protein